MRRPYTLEFRLTMFFLALYTLLTVQTASVTSELSLMQDLQPIHVIQYQTIEKMCRLNFNEKLIKPGNLDLISLSAVKNNNGNRAGYRKLLLPLAVTAGAGLGVFLIYSVRGR